jgi:hypothetical protein
MGASLPFRDVLGFRAPRRAAWYSRVRTKPPGFLADERPTRKLARKAPTVAVGTTIADRPPRRSVRARLRIRLLLRMSRGECCLPHTVQSLGHAFPALCRAHVRLNDVLLSLCPSLPGLRGRLPFVVRLVHRYYDTVRLLLYVHVRRSVYGLRGPVLIC